MSEFSSKDIEVAPTTESYIAGTIMGTTVTFQRVLPIGPSITACGTGLSPRAFLAQIDPLGNPIWVSEVQESTGGFPTFGEGLTYDSANGRIFVCGYSGTNYVSGTLNFNNFFACATACTTPLSPTLAPNIGFIGEYDMNGICREGTTIGERVMAVVMDKNNPDFVWVNRNQP